MTSFDLCSDPGTVTIIVAIFQMVKLWPREVLLLESQDSNSGMFKLESGFRPLWPQSRQAGNLSQTKTQLVPEFFKNQGCRKEVSGLEISEGSRYHT